MLSIISTWRATPRFAWTSARSVFPGPSAKTVPSFTVHGVGAGARVFERGAAKHDVSVWVENATNELYAEFSNATFFRPEPGRTLKLSYRVGF